MKLALLAFAAVTLFGLATHAQTTKFEGIGFKAPTGFTRSEQSGALIFTHANGSETCIMSLFKPADATDDPGENFDTFWKKLAGIDIVADLPEKTAPKLTMGWNIVTGISNGTYLGKPMVVALVNATSGHRTVNLLVISNSDSYSGQISQFIDSIVLPDSKTPAISKPRSGTASAGNQVGSINGSYAGCLTWGYNYGSSNVVVKAGSMPFFSISGNRYTVVNGKGGSVSYSNGILSFSGGDFNGFKAVHEILNDGSSTILFRVNRFRTSPISEGKHVGDQQCHRQR